MAPDTVPDNFWIEKANRLYDISMTLQAASLGLFLVFDQEVALYDLTTQRPLGPGQTFFLGAQKTVKSGKINVHIGRLLTDARSGKHFTSGHMFNSLFCMGLNAAYELVKDDLDDSPACHFFRHVRNAASHRNEFFFKNDQPSKPAEWRGLTIDHFRKGASNPLFGTPCVGTFIDVGDVCVLLYDISRLLGEPTGEVPSP